MKKITEDNTVSIIQKALRYFRVPATNRTIKESLKAHSQYPTFKSICDVLSYFKIEHYPLKFQADELKEIPHPYIVHFNSGGGHIAFVTKIKGDRVTYFDSLSLKRQVSNKDFYDACSGAIILLYPDGHSGEKNYRKNRQNEILKNSVLPVAVLTFILFVVSLFFPELIQNNLHPDKTNLALLVTKSLGIIFSTLLVLHEFEIHGALTDKLCHINRSTNCHTILNDAASKFFSWFGWADTGFVYFTGSFLLLLQGFNEANYSLLAIVASLAIPYPLYSVYYQGFVLKKWCPLCLGVQMVLIAEFVLLLPQLSDLYFSIRNISNFIMTFLITGIIYVTINMYFRERMSNEINYDKYLGFKRNSLILRSLLLSQKHYEIPVTETSLFFGLKDSPVIITAFLSLHCSHCARAFFKIREILDTETSSGFNIILMAPDIKVLNTLHYLNRNDKKCQALDLLDSWYNTEPYSRYKISDSFCIPEVDDVLGEVTNENIKLFKLCNVIGTPTFFINGYKLTNQYDIEDYKLFYELFSIS